MACFTQNHPLKIIFQDQEVQNKKVQGYECKSVIISTVGHGYCLGEKPFIWRNTSAHVFSQALLYAISLCGALPRPRGARDLHMSECFPFFTGEREGNLNITLCYPVSGIIFLQGGYNICLMKGKFSLKSH